MKFMRLGSKPNAFQSSPPNSIRCISSELATDFTITVDQVTFHLHKFPLLSKSNRLQKLALHNSHTIRLPDFPGGPNAFEICAKFCYGITVSLSPYNVVAARCAAEYLQMTEDVDNGNLIFKIEVFFKSSILHSWKDSIIVLQTTAALLPWSDDIGIVERCIDSISAKTSLDPSCIHWSYTYNRKLDVTNKVRETGSVPKDWWVEDLSELDIDVYKRVMLAVKSKATMEGNVIGEALKTYCLRWLPDGVNGGFEADEVDFGRYKSLIESIICLLPWDAGAGGFLLKLLKISVLVGVDASVKEDLINDISSKLDEASVGDLLIPAEPPQTTVYDIELVQRLVDRFFMQENEKVLNLRACMAVGRLIDGYLAEVGRDGNLGLSGFTRLLRSVPEGARGVQDGVYGAIDGYLKEHPGLTKGEKKTLCELIDVKRLSRDASMHAAQNERLPLRMVVQMLVYEQVRAAKARDNHVKKGEWDIRRSKSLRAPGQDVEKLQLVPVPSRSRSRSRRILDKFWGQGESKSSSSSSRKQRNSVS